MSNNTLQIIGTWLKASQFIKLGIYSASSFYRLAPQGKIAGAFKIGKFWFVDMKDFKEAHKPSKKS